MRISGWSSDVCSSNLSRDQQLAVQHAEIGFNDRLLCRSQSRVGLDDHCYFGIPVFVFSNDIFGLAEQLGLTAQPTEHKVAILAVFLAIGAYVDRKIVV